MCRIRNRYAVGEIAFALSSDSSFGAQESDWKYTFYAQALSRNGTRRKNVLVGTLTNQ